MPMTTSTTDFIIKSPWDGVNKRRGSSMKKIRYIGKNNYLLTLRTSVYTITLVNDLCNYDLDLEMSLTLTQILKNENVHSP